MLRALTWIGLPIGPEHLSLPTVDSTLFMPMLRFGSRWVQAPEIAESNRLVEYGNGLGSAKFRVGRGSRLPAAGPDASKLDHAAGCRWSPKARSKPLRCQRNAEPLVLRLAFRTQPAPTIAIHHSVD
jgi:hypothetical protein